MMSEAEALSLSSGMSPDEAVRQASRWWDQTGRHLIPQALNLETPKPKVTPHGKRSPAVVVKEADRPVLGSGILRGLPFDELNREEKLKVVKQWHDNFVQPANPPEFKHPTLLKLCHDHWQRLKDAVEDRGLEDFVAKDDAELITRLEAAVMPGGQGDIRMADPIFYANARIIQNVIDIAGAAALHSDECPLCSLKSQGGEPADWINGAAEDALNAWKRAGLVVIQ